ncbi:LppU/SCO3897 family protein [Embleya sp. AB8]|uniref:LppU/SCO3897 family protein n=1 Tax=Embleya sp. AB8 TaxID=3156304 RepID=UPI003C75300A
MSNNAGSGENKPLPYVPAWTENTTPDAAPPTGRRARAGSRSSRRRGRVALITLAAALLVGAGSAGGWWYVHKDDGGPRIHEGDCLRSRASVDQDPVDCEDPAARFVVVERIEWTTSAAVCGSVPGEPIPLASNPAPDGFVLCLAARK